jgi:hypothetical protein
MSDSIVSVYSDARTEYTKQLCAFLVPAYFQFFLNLLEKAKTIAQSETKKVLWHYQTLLNDIPEWNMEKVNTEITNIQSSSGCDYLDDLLTAVFIAHTKVLTAIRLSSNKKKVQITVPKVEHFLFKVLCETSKLLWGSTYLFRDDISSIEKQQNYRSIEGLLQEGIVQAVRSLVPVKSILKDFVSNEDSDEEGEKDEKEEHEQVKEEKIEKEEQKEETKVEQGHPVELKISENTVVDTSTAESTHSASELLEDTDIPVSEEKISEQTTSTENIITEPPIIRIDEKPEVSFANYDAVFDSDNPERSDMVNGIRSSGIEDLGGPEEPLSADEDFEDLENEPTTAPLDDYEVLV